MVDKNKIKQKSNITSKKKSTSKKVDKKQDSKKKDEKKEKMKPTSKKKTKELEFKTFVQGSVAYTGLEVYMTDEDNFVPYVSANASAPDAENKEEDDSDSNEGFKLHQGEIVEQYHYNNLFSFGFEQDYADISDNGEVKIEDVDLKKFYKGVRVCLKKRWKSPTETIKWDDLNEVLLGFITEQTFSENETSLKINGMSKLLDQKFIFNFSNMKRSEILSEIIKTAGLNPIINIEGLDDDVTSFSNKTSESSSGSSSDLAGGEGEEIDSLVAKICNGISNDLEKCKAIHEWLRQNVVYSSYACSHYNTPAKCLQNKGHLNCADTARLTRSMMASAGLKAYVAHHSQGCGHFWTVIVIDGKKYCSDQTGRESAGMAGSKFNTVWYPSGRRSESNGGASDRNCGNNPSC